MMLNVMVACGCGMGSSQMLKMRAQAVLKELGVEAKIHHTSIDEAKSTASNYDLVIISEGFIRNFKVGEKTTIIGLKNIMSKVELKEKLEASNILSK